MRLLLLPLLIFASLVFACFARAECNKTFVVGTSAGVIAKKSAAINDLANALWNEVKKHTSCQFDERPVSFNTALEKLKTYNLDIVAFAFPDPQWDEVADRQTLYSADRLLLVSKKFYKENLTVGDYLANRKIIFGTPSSGLLYIKSDELARLKKENRIVYDPFTDGVLQLLARKKVSAAFVGPAFYRHYEAPLGLKEIAQPVVDKKETLSLSIYFSRRRVSKKDQEIFATAIRQMRDDGSLRKVLLQFVSEDDLKKYYHITN